MVSFEGDHEIESENQAFLGAINAMKSTNPNGFGIHPLLIDNSVEPIVTKIDFISEIVAPRQKLQAYQQVMTV